MARMSYTTTTATERSPMSPTRLELAVWNQAHFTQVLHFLTTIETAGSICMLAATLPSVTSVTASWATYLAVVLPASIGEVSTRFITTTATARSATSPRRRVYTNRKVRTSQSRPQITTMMAGLTCSSPTTA